MGCLMSVSKSPHVVSQATTMEVFWEFWWLEVVVLSEEDSFNVRQCGQGKNACASLAVFEVSPKWAGVIYEQR